MPDVQHIPNLDPVRVTVRTLAHGVGRTAGAPLRERLDHLKPKLPTGSYSGPYLQRSHGHDLDKPFELPVNIRQVLVEKMLPEWPMRQYVLSLPFALRAIPHINGKADVLYEWRTTLENLSMLMNSVNQDAAAGLWDECDPPCLSLFQPTHRNHPDNQQDSIRFKNLVKALEESLQKQFESDEIEHLLEPMLALAEDHDFWNCTLDGLAVLRSRSTFRVYKLQRPVPELAVVADSFHTKPLLRILQSADRYQVLALNRHEIRLFEGKRDALDEIAPADGVPRTLIEALGDELTDPRQTVSAYGGSGGGQAPMHHGHGGRKDELDHDAERFFRVVDRAVLEHHSKPSGLPLLLAALPEHHHRFHALSHNPFLMSESLDVHPDAIASIDEFRERIWQTVEPRYLARLAGLVDTFGSHKPKGLAADDLAEVARAAVGGRVATLLIEARREIPGRVDPSTGALEFDDLSHPETDDVLDDLGAVVLKMGGDVVVVPTERMPTETGIAAIYRY